MCSRDKHTMIFLVFYAYHMWCIIITSSNLLSCVHATPGWCLQNQAFILSRNNFTVGFSPIFSSFSRFFLQGAWNFVYWILFYFFSRFLEHIGLILSMRTVSLMNEKSDFNFCLQEQSYLFDRKFKIYFSKLTCHDSNVHFHKF